MDELIKSTEAAYAAEELPKDVTAAQTALRQHNDGRHKLHQLINYTSDEADQIIIRVRQQVIDTPGLSSIQRAWRLGGENRREKTERKKERISGKTQVRRHIMSGGLKTVTKQANVHSCLIDNNYVTLT